MKILCKKVTDCVHKIAAASEGMDSTRGEISCVFGETMPSVRHVVSPCTSTQYQTVIHQLNIHIVMESFSDFLLVPERLLV